MLTIFQNLHVFQVTKVDVRVVSLLLLDVANVLAMSCRDFFAYFVGFGYYIPSRVVI